MRRKQSLKLFIAYYSKKPTAYGRESAKYTNGNRERGEDFQSIAVKELPRHHPVFDLVDGVAIDSERGGDIVRFLAVHRHAQEHLASAGLDRLVAQKCR